MLSVQQLIQQRARMFQNIRAFFAQRDIVEVDTPLLASSTNTDVHIQSISARVNGAGRYLQTSPEFAMKRLLAAGSGSIYQIAHAFRDEERGRYHHAEFSLLEWYSLGFDYRQLMDQVEQLLCLLFDHSLPPFRRITYHNCFSETLGLDLAIISIDDLRQCVKRQSIDIDASSLQFDDCLDLLMSQVISPRFQGFTFVYDYPATQAALARLKAEDIRLAERFELFHDGLELANGFSELTDAQEQRQRFENDNRQRRLLGLPVYPLDEEFLAALQQGLPECAGVALGLDRLLMVLCGASHIDEVMFRSH